MIRKGLILSSVVLTEIVIINLGYTYFLDFTFKTCKSCTFIDDVRMFSLFTTPVFFAIIYSLIGLYLNIKTIREFRASSYFALIGLTILDIALVPLSMVISLAYFRTKGISEIGLKEIINPFVMIFVVLCKHIVILAINDFIVKAKR